MATATRTALVLGAGIMGLSAAWALARAGWAVRVLEQDSIPNPRGASVDHHRLIRHAYGAEAGYMRMTDAAFAAWEVLWAELGARHYQQTGVLALAEGPGGWLADSLEALRAAGHVPEDLGAAAIATRWPMLSPEGIHAAFHMAPGGVLLAERIVASLAARCAALGVGFERATVRDAQPASASLLLADGTRRGADLLVLAAGPWAPRLLPGLASRVTASRQVVVMLEPPEAHRAAWQTAPMLLDLAEDGGFFAVPPVAGTPLKIGDHRFSLAGDAEDPRETTAAEVEEILALARRRLPGLDGYRRLGASACYYDVTAGERFILEFAAPRCLVMSGFSGHGFKFGPLLGLAAARAVADPALAASLPPWAAGLAPPPQGLLQDIA